MPVFSYKGLNKQGRNVRGSIDADNMRSARNRLKKDGIYVVDIKDKSKSIKKASGKKGVRTGGVSVQDIAMTTRQLAVLLKANVPLVDTIGAVSEQSENPTMKEVLAEVKTAVNEGSAFHKAIGKYKKIFNKIYVSMCEAGEMSGTLDIILLRLAEFTEAQNELNSRIKSAMLYPILMAVVSVLLLMGIFVFIIPKMTAIFDSSPELTLEWYTLMVIDFSEILVEYWMQNPH